MHSSWLIALLTFRRVSHASPVQPAGQRHQPARWSHTPAGSSAGWTAASGQRWWQRSRQKSASDGRAPRTTLTHKIAAPQAGSVCCGRRLGRDGRLHQVVSAPSARGPPASLLYVLRSGRRCCHFKLYHRCRHWRRCRCLRLGDCRRRCQRRCAAGSSRPIHGAGTRQRLPDRLRHLQKWPGCYLRRRGGNRTGHGQEYCEAHLDVLQHHSGVPPQWCYEPILPADDSSEGKGQGQQGEGGGAQWRAGEPVGRHHTVV